MARQFLKQVTVIFIHCIAKFIMFYAFCAPCFMYGYVQFLHLQQEKCLFGDNKVEADVDAAISFLLINIYNTITDIITGISLRAAVMTRSVSAFQSCQ